MPLPAGCLVMKLEHFVRYKILITTSCQCEIIAELLNVASVVLWKRSARLAGCHRNAHGLILTKVQKANARENIPRGRVAAF